MGNDDFMLHRPLPYVVRIRRTKDDDSAPVASEHRVSAYSVMESVLQVIFQSGGSGLGDARVHIDSVEPDVPAWLRTLAQAATGKRAGKGA